MLFALVSGLVGTAMLTAQGGERPVGYRTVHVTGADGGTLPVSVWYPTEARARPTTLLGLVVMPWHPTLPSPDVTCRWS